MSKRITREQAAEFLTEEGFPITKSTLHKMACIGGGPPYVKFGKRALYTREELLAWAEARTVGKGQEENA